ncbi:MAG TPA: amidase family protein [Acidimicrobiales bacterium]|jgi:amidase|nr:amidase family protein [Acidimicrobiales bacterium]
MDTCLQSATHLASRIRNGSLSSRELTNAYLDRIDRLNPALNAVVTIDRERALEEADAADAAGPGGPLHGLPITIKDAIEVAGMRSTGGAMALRDFVPPVDAPVVARLRRAGAIVIGKTNVPEWSGDIQTYNQVFGTTNNPWDQSVTTGGSSGGPAAAVAAGLSSFEVGTDIGGSIRIPSSYCGVCGHKPSYGIIPQRGYLDSVGGGTTDADINVFGPIARSVEDLSLLLDVMAGPVAEDAVGWRLELPPARHSSLADYRVGLWLDDPACRVDSGALALMEAAAAEMARAGAQVTDARPPLDLAEVRSLFESLLIPAISPSHDGELGQALGGNHRIWLDQNRARAAVRQVWADWFRNFDVLLCPVMPMLPFPHDQAGSVADRVVQINGEARPQSLTLAWTGLVGVAYLPATVVPVGRVGDLPVGMQIVGPFLEDRTPLFVGAALTDLLGGYMPPPQFT